MAYDAYFETRHQRSPSSLNTPVKTGAAQFLAYLASAPLIAAALVTVAGDERAVSFAVYGMGVYGAALIVFFGGVRWGVAVMKEGGPTMRALWGACLPLAAAMPLFAPIGVYWKFPAIMALIALLLIDDMKATRRGSGAPHWYLAARVPLTVLIELAFIVAIVGMVR